MSAEKDPEDLAFQKSLMTTALIYWEQFTWETETWLSSVSESKHTHTL